MERVFGQINVVKFNLRNRMNAELINVILNIRTGLKRDKTAEHVMIMAEIPESVTI